MSRKLQLSKSLLTLKLCSHLAVHWNPELNYTKITGQEQQSVQATGSEILVPSEILIKFSYIIPLK